MREKIDNILKNHVHLAGAQNWYYNEETGTIHHPKLNNTIEDYFNAAHEAGHAKTPTFLYLIHKAIPIKLIQILLEVVAILIGATLIDFKNQTKYFKHSANNLKLYFRATETKTA